MAEPKEEELLIVNQKGRTVEAATAGNLSDVFSTFRYFALTVNRPQ